MGEAIRLSGAIDAAAWWTQVASAAGRCGFAPLLPNEPVGVFDFPGELGTVHQRPGDSSPESLAERRKSIQVRRQSDRRLYITCFGFSREKAKTAPLQQSLPDARDVTGSSHGDDGNAHVQTGTRGGLSVVRE